MAKLLDDAQVQFTSMFEVEYWTKLEELKNEMDGKLLHHQATHIVLRDLQVIGDNEAFTTFLSEEYGYTDSEASKTVIYNKVNPRGIFQ